MCCVPVMLNLPILWVGSLTDLVLEFSLKLQNFGHLMRRADSLKKEPTPFPDAEKDWRLEENGMTEDEMVGWHYWISGREFEQSSGDSEGQGSLAWSMRSQRVGHDWVNNSCLYCPSCIVSDHLAALLISPKLSSSLSSFPWVLIVPSSVSPKHLVALYQHMCGAIWHVWWLEGCHLPLVLSPESAHHGVNAYWMLNTVALETPTAERSVCGKNGLESKTRRNFQLDAYVWSGCCWGPVVFWPCKGSIISLFSVELHRVSAEFSSISLLWNPHSLLHKRHEKPFATFGFSIFCFSDELESVGRAPWWPLWSRACCVSTGHILIHSVSSGSAGDYQQCFTGSIWREGGILPKWLVYFFF